MEFWQDIKYVRYTYDYELQHSKMEIQHPV
jgi:hypothetical protein